MAEAFSFNREFDFVRLEGLRRTTGRPAHEWDFYILKELIDNALDADEGLWREDLEQHPILKMRIEYAAKQLFVQVSNRSVFPANLIPEIFATRQYTSRKAFIKGLTRGALGNALKTLLGIPYALRNRVASDWSPDQKPLSIICDGKEYLPTYLVDTTEQVIQLECAEKLHRQTEGTTVRVALDYFEQEKPRTLAEIQRLAKQYRLCNPHVEFHWNIEVEDEEWSVSYEENTDWMTKFRGVAPIQWYSLTAFQDLLGALHRKQNEASAENILLVESISACFGNFADTSVGASGAKELTTKLLEEFGKESLAVEDFEAADSKKLHQLMCKLNPPFDSLQLGFIGKERISHTLAEIFFLDGDIFYDISRDVGDEPSIPFVIEVAIAPLQEGSREIWTAINFSPTYDDPFLRRRLLAPMQTDRAVIGLREFLDVYGIDEETPAIVFLHLICPSIESGEFSKTEINHLPFKQVMGEVLDRLLKAFHQAKEEQELRLEQTIFRVLDEILDSLKENERFVFDQLLEKLRNKLGQEETLATWLQNIDAEDRLRSFLTKYQSQSKILTQRVARSAVGTLMLPSHPDRYFSIQAEHVSQELLEQSHVNKILYSHIAELEPVIIENGWLCRMDIALLRNTPRREALQEALIQCVVGSELPILFLRDDDSKSLEALEQTRSWLAERHLNDKRIVDLVWQATFEKSEQIPTRLVGMMPDELFTWVLSQLGEASISYKFLPVAIDIRREISQRFEQLLLSYLWEGISQRLEISHFLDVLDQQLNFTQVMQTQALDQRLQDLLQAGDRAQSYSAVLDRTVKQFFDYFINQHAAEIQELTKTHLHDVNGG
ncbi:ATP-binding protein [Nodosilinea sp. LEGE 07088]|uniref:ATP-binding protein n=1 Tax=Nodosilinea sp. LEGE 07088 TaxID=2777968 RepID=UPI001881B552|nr:ATP-binding protein [Nodosilinea sp. LEGE 07088]MBE9138022.1 ATP-binding protein [Nodosilinea sp. LEGE 07088]